MKILHIIPSLEIGGAERLAIDIVGALNKVDKIDASLVVLHDNIAYDVSSIEQVLKVIPAKIHLSIYRRNKFDLAKLQNYVDEFAPDVIHTHLYEAEIIAKSLRYSKASWFCHFHDNMPQMARFSLKTVFNKSLLINFFERSYLLQKIKAFKNNYIAISQDTKNYAEKVLGKKAKVTYLKNAISFNKFFTTIKVLDKNNVLKLINVGSFQHKKNQQFLMDVVNLLVKSGIQVQLDLLGDGEHKKDVMQKCEGLGLKEYVNFRGNVKDVPRYLGQSDMYVHSAYYEPFGLVLLEAMAAGLPVVSLNARGNEDITIHGENGYIFPEANPQEFATCIQSLSEDADLYKRIASKGQELAREYDILDYTKNLIRLYKESVKN